MSNLAANEAPPVIGKVTVTLYGGGRLEIRPEGMMSPEILQSVLLQSLLIVASQIFQQVSGSIIVAGGGANRGVGA